MSSDLMDWVTHTARKKKNRIVSLGFGGASSLNLVDWHAQMNQAFYFQYVLFGCHDRRALLDAVLARCHVVDGAICLRVLQEAQILLGLLIFQKVNPKIDNQSFSAVLKRG